MKSLVVTSSIIVLLSVIGYVTGTPAWTRGPTGKYYIQLQTRFKNKEESKKLCEESGGFLPQPINRVETDFLKNHFIQMFYLGMSYNEDAMMWMWDTCPVKVKWFDWRTTKEPSGGVDDNCVLSLFKENGWSDDSCTIKATIVVCERQNSTSTTSCEKKETPRCKPTTCQNKGQCTNTATGVSCNCTNTGFTGDRCQSDFNECVSSTNNQCRNGAKCVNIPGSYTCNCDFARGRWQGRLCDLDVDECALSVTNKCEKGAKCINNPGSYTCIAIPRCKPTTCQNKGHCTTTATGVSCNCTNSGYTGDRCQSDINECLTPGLNPCVRGVCRNTHGSATCDCTNTAYDGPTCETEKTEDCLPPYFCQNNQKLCFKCKKGKKEGTCLLLKIEGPINKPLSYPVHYSDAIDPEVGGFSCSMEIPVRDMENPSTMPQPQRLKFTMNISVSNTTKSFQMDYVIEPRWVTYEETGKQYILLKRKSKNFQESKSLCNDIGAILPEPQNWKENNFLYHFTTLNDLAWLGLTDEQSEGRWVRANDSSVPQKFLSFKRDEPNGGRRENCVSIHGWVDVPCNTPGLVLCEKSSFTDFSSTSTKIHRLGTKEKMRCSVKHRQNMTNVTSIVISNNGVKVAKITQNDSVRSVGNSKVLNVTGSLTATLEELGFLELTLTNSGNYTCDIKVKDKLGNTTYIYRVLNIDRVAETNSDIVDYLLKQKKLQSHGNTPDVFFSVGFSSIKNETIPSGQILIFKQIFSAKGGGYDPATGVFTCPVAGFYNFIVHAQTEYSEEVALHVQHNGRNVFDVSSRDGYAYQDVSNSAILKLKKRDTVRVVSYDDETEVHSTVESVTTTFSGHLISVV